MHRLVACGVCILCLGSGSAARAQSDSDTVDAASADATNEFMRGLPALSRSLTGEALQQYQAARLLLDVQDYAGALVKFRRALDLGGDVRLLWNMALCENGLRHYANALELLRQYRAATDAQLTDTHRAELESIMQTLRGLVSSVRVLSNESGASVYVDGKLRGDTPLPEFLLDLGPRHFKVTKPGFADTNITQEIVGGSALTIPVNLIPIPAAKTSAAPALARLTVSAAPGATIWIDGAIAGQQPWTGKLEPGPHKLRVTAPKMSPHEQTLTLHAGRPLALNIALKEDASSGMPVWLWVGAGAVTACGAALGAYFLLRDSPEQPQPYVGSLGTVVLPAPRPGR